MQHEPGLVVLCLGRIVVEEDIRQHHRADLQPVVQHPRHREVVQHMAAEAADRALLDRDHDLVFASQPIDEIGVERLGKASIGNCRRQSISAEFLRRLVDPSTQFGIHIRLPARNAGDGGGAETRGQRPGTARVSEGDSG